MQIRVEPRQVIFGDNGWQVTVSAQQKGTYDEIEHALQIALEEVRTRINNGLQLF
jgi:hypothetical protein